MWKSDMKTNESGDAGSGGRGGGQGRGLTVLGLLLALGGLNCLLKTTYLKATRMMSKQNTVKRHTDANLDLLAFSLQWALIFSDIDFEWLV